MAIDQKLPPQALDAEMAVLGSMLIEKDAVDRAFEILEPEHFYKAAHKQIFVAMKNLSTKGQAIDLITVTEELKKTGLLAQVGAERYLSELMDKVSTAAHVEYYANIVRETALVRELISVSTSTIENCYSHQKEAYSLIDDAQSQLFALSQKREMTGFVSSKVLSEQVSEDFERLIKEKNPIKGVPTGFTQFDIKTGGLRKGDLVILAARPSQGKTAMALNIAYHAAVNAKKAVAIFSLEMGRKAIYQRMVCSAAKAEMYLISAGRFPKDRWKDIAIETEKLGQAALYIDDSSALSITDIRVRSRRLATELAKEGKELGLIIIDYMQMIRGTNKKVESRQQEVSEVSRMLKELARNLNVPVMALSQLNRRTEDRGRTDNRPQLSDLRESGSIEQDADVVALIHREGYYKRDEESLKDTELQEKATLIIAKQRNGPVGDVKLRWLDKFTLFTNPIPANINMPEEEGEVYPV